MATGFDVQAAKQAGYSDQEIIAHLASTRKFDVDGAHKAGYSDQEIMAHISNSQAAAPAPQRPQQPSGDPAVQDLTEMAKGAVSNIANITAPGIAARYLADKSPQVRSFFEQNFPEWLQPAPFKEVPGDVVLNAGPMMIGADAMPRNSVPGAPGAAASTARGLAADFGRDVLRETPVVGKAVRLAEKAGKWSGRLSDLFSKTEAPPAPPAPPVPAHWGRTNVGPPEMWGRAIQPEAAPVPAPAPPEAPPITAGPSTVPRTLSGEGVLGDVLSELDNATLLKVAKSRGINVTREAQLKPGTADSMLIRKITDSFSPEELDNVRSTGLETSRFQGSHNNYATPKVAAEAWHNKVLQTYFPDVRIPAASLKRTIPLSSLLGAK